MKRIIITAIITYIVLSLSIMNRTLYDIEDRLYELKCPKIDTIYIYKPCFYNKSPEEGLMEALYHYKVKYPDIVYAQAILETGWFNSDLCKEYNNLFGLYNSRKKEFFKFNHWHESVAAYKNMVQYKYKDSINYYTFLKELPYAEDKEYVNKVKRLVYETNKSTN